MEQKGEIYEEILRGLGNKLHMVEGRDRIQEGLLGVVFEQLDGGQYHSLITVITRVTAALRENNYFDLEPVELKISIGHSGLGM